MCFESDVYIFVVAYIVVLALDKAVDDEAPFEAFGAHPQRRRGQAGRRAPSPPALSQHRLLLLREGVHAAGPAAIRRRGRRRRTAVM